MLDQRENMFQNIFCRDYFGFNGPFDCAKQINIQNTVLIKLSSACLQKQNTRPIYGERHLKKYCMPLNHVHYKPICLVSSLLLPHRQFCFFLYCFQRVACWNQGAGSPGSPLTFLFLYFCLWHLLEPSPFCHWEESLGFPWQLMLHLLMQVKVLFYYDFLNRMHIPHSLFLASAKICWNYLT